MGLVLMPATPETRNGGSFRGGRPFCILNACDGCKRTLLPHSKTPPVSRLAAHSLHLKRSSTVGDGEPLPALGGTQGPTNKTKSEQHHGPRGGLGNSGSEIAIQT